MKLQLFTPILLCALLPAQNYLSSLDPSLQSPLLDLPSLGPTTCILDWDFDADGDRDLLVGTASSIHVLRNEGCSGRFVDVQATVLGPSSFNGFTNPGVLSGAVGDVDRDGVEDVVLRTSIFPQSTWIVRGGLVAGLLRTTQLNLFWPDLAEIALVDIVDPLDGVVDLVACAPSVPNPTTPISFASVGALFVARNTTAVGGTPQFAEASPPAAPTTVPGSPDSNYTSIAVADFTGDGNPDVLVSGGTYQLGSSPASWVPVFGVDRLYAFAPGNPQLVDVTATAFAGAATAQQRGDFWVEPIDFDGDGDLDLVVNHSAIVFGGPVPQLVTGLRWHANNGPAAVPQFAAPVGLSLVGQPWNSMTPVPVGDFIVGDITNDGLPDLVHSAGVIDSATMPMTLVPNFFAADPPRAEGLNGVVADLDCSGFLDLISSSNDPLAGPINMVAQLDARLRLDGPPSPTWNGSIYVEPFTLLDPQSVFGWLVVSDGQTNPGVPLPGFQGLIRLGSNFLILDPLMAPTFNFAAFVPSGVTLFFQAIDAGDLSTDLGFTNALAVTF